MHFSKTIQIAGLLLLASFARAQTGCTDPQATNFNANAVQNDGSCLYPQTSYSAALLSTLGSELHEISGLTLANGAWWAHNDSGSDPEFFRINVQNGGVLQKIELKDAHNKDWEDMCADAANVYLGDFGNNNNDRQNLGVYKVPFSAIGNNGDQSVNANAYSFLPFVYPDQLDFSTTAEDSTVFDCEAMLYAQGKLHFFTKNRKEYKTTHYSLDLSNNSIQKLETFDAQGLITGASMAPDGKTIALVGYDLRGLPTVFCWLLWDWQAGTEHFFSGNKRRIELGSAFTVGQVESIGFSTDRTAYFANERTMYAGVLFVPQRIWSIDFSAWLPEIVGTKNLLTSSPNLRIFPNPSTGILHLEFDVQNSEKAILQLVNHLGAVVAQIKGLSREIDISHLSPGVYSLLSIWEDGTTEAQPLILR